MIFETSWDDGHKLDLKLATLLRKYKIPATFYIPTDTKELTWPEVRRLAKDFEIGSHTITHPQDLKKLDYVEKWSEIQTSKDILEKMLDKPVKKFCYPRGRFDEECVEIVRDAGYEEARTTMVDYLYVGKSETPFSKPTAVHVYPREEYGDKHWLVFARELFDEADRGGDWVFHLWGHSWEIEKLGLWVELEEFFRYVKHLHS